MSSSRKLPLINACLAMLVYGVWAVYANIEHGKAVAVMAGSVQGVYAFTSTLSVTLVALWVYQRCRGGIWGAFSGFYAAFAVMLLIPWVVHTLAGTPNILKTILPGLVWGSAYLTVILYLQVRRGNETPITSKLK